MVGVIVGVVFLYSHVTEAQQWMVAINKAAAMYSAPPLAAPIGSG